MIFKLKMEENWWQAGDMHLHGRAAHRDGGENRTAKDSFIYPRFRLQLVMFRRNFIGACWWRTQGTDREISPNTKLVAHPWVITHCHLTANQIRVIQALNHVVRSPPFSQLKKCHTAAPKLMPLRLCASLMEYHTGAHAEIWSRLARFPSPQ